MTISTMARAVFVPALLVAVATTVQAATIIGSFAGTTTLQDTDTGLAWLGFASQSEGAAAGFRLATGAEFNQLMLNAGLEIRTSAPVLMPWSPEDALRKESLETELSIPRLRESYRQYLQSELDALNAAHAPQPGLIDPAAGISYAKPGGNGSLSIPGVNVYSNFNGYGNPETHEHQFAWVAEGGQLLMTDVAYHYVPSQCPYDPYGGDGVRYCGGNSNEWAAVGPQDWFATSRYSQWNEFNTMNWADQPSEPGFLMVRAVPEPSTLAMVVTGLGGLIAVTRRRRG